MKIIIRQGLTFPCLPTGPVVILFPAKDKARIQVAISPIGISRFPSFPPLSSWAEPGSQLPGVCLGAVQTYLPIPGTDPAFGRWQNRSEGCCAVPAGTDRIVLLTKKKLLELQLPSGPILVDLWGQRHRIDMCVCVCIYVDAEVDADAKVEVDPGLSQQIWQADSVHSISHSSLKLI